MRFLFHNKEDAYNIILKCCGDDADRTEVQGLVTLLSSEFSSPFGFSFCCVFSSSFHVSIA